MKFFMFNKATTPFMEVSATSIYYRCTYEIAKAAHMSNITYFITPAVLSTCSYQI